MLVAFILVCLFCLRWFGFECYLFLVGLCFDGLCLRLWLCIAWKLILGSD